LLRALLLQVLYTTRSERLLMEQLKYNLLFRWFMGLNMDDPVWDPSTFSKRRERLLEGNVAHAFFDHVLAQAGTRWLLSDEYFTVDGTLIEAWAGQKSFKRKAPDTPPSPPDEPGNPSINFRGERCTNAPHASTTDPEARLYKKTKGQEAKLCYLGHVLMENRHGLVINTRVTQATGTAEREAALAMAEAIPGQQRATLGADKTDDTRDFVHELRELRVTPHLAQHTTGRSSAIDGRTTRPPGNAVSQRKGKGVEEIFGRMKTVGLLRQSRYRGVARIGWMCTYAPAGYNLVRMRTLAEAARDHPGQSRSSRPRHLEIRFPRVQGYRVELPEERLTAEFNDDSVLELTPDLIGPSITKNAGIIGEDVDLSLAHLEDMRRSTLLFHVPQRLLYTKWRDPGEEPKLHLFGQLKRITKQWLDTGLVCKGGTYPVQLMYQELADMACERITAGITCAPCVYRNGLTVMLGGPRMTGCPTSKPCARRRR
jgi:IS5 family transposase